MKKASGKVSDDLRPEYKRSDFGTLVRGKYAHRVVDVTNVVVLDPKVAKAFPNDRAVNKALGGLLRDRKSSGRLTTRSRRTRRERRAGQRCVGITNQLRCVDGATLEFGRASRSEFSPAYGGRTEVHKPSNSLRRDARVVWKQAK